MNQFIIENPRIEVVEGSEMAVFDLISVLGRVELLEHVNRDSEGNFESLEVVDSHIVCNMQDELCSVFDMTEKPALMADINYVPLAKILVEVTECLKG